MHSTQRMISAMPWISSRTPVTGISALSGNTGTPAGLKMLTSRKRTDMAAKFQPAYMKAQTAGRKKMM